MRRALCLSALLSAIGWFGTAQAASPSLNTVQVHRNLIRLNVHLYTTLPAGSMVVCKAELVPETVSPGGNRQDFVLGFAAGAASLQGSSGICMVEIPLCWTGNGLPSSVTLRFEVDAETRPGAPLVVLRRGFLRAPAGSDAAYPTLSLNLGAIP